MPANGEVENGSFVYLNRHSAAHVVAREESQETTMRNLLMHRVSGLFQRLDFQNQEKERE